MAKIDEKAAAETAKYGLSPVMQNWPAFMPGQQNAIAGQLAQGYGGSPADYTAWQNTFYRPMNFNQYQMPAPAAPGTGGGTTVDPALTWALYKEQYKRGDGSKYPAGMNQAAFDAWLATQGTAPAAAPAAAASSAPVTSYSSPLAGVMNASQPMPRFSFGSMEDRDALRRTGQIGGLF